MEKRQTYNIYTTCYGGNAGANARNNLCKSILFRIVYLNKSFLHFFLIVVRLTHSYRSNQIFERNQLALEHSIVQFYI